MKLDFYLQGIATNGPGFSCWDEFLLLNKENEFLKQKTAFPPAIHLPATERRRVTATIKLALGLADAACVMALSNKDVASFFASSKGDTDIMHYLGQTLATKERFVSPTKFHNSLHNSASGYWSIASHSHAPVQALAAGAITFQAGLIETAMYTAIELAPALLVNYDIAPPEQLEALMQSHYSFGSALYTSPTQSSESIAKIGLTFVNNEQVTSMDNSQLEMLRLSNNAALSLPLLQALAEQKNKSVTLPYLEQQLRITVEF